MEEFRNEHIAGTMEAILFVSDKPVTLDQFKEVLETVNAAFIKQTISNLQKEYEQRNRGMVIVEIAGGYQMLSSMHYAMAIRRFYKTKHKEKLSQPALETLAIIAYKQPVTRLDIELIRGVNSDGVSEHLLSKGLIDIVGRKEVPGRPFLYGTTKRFLEYFGLKSLADLPKLEEFSLLQPAQEISELDRDVKLPEVAPAESGPIKKEVKTFLKEAQEFVVPTTIEQEAVQEDIPQDALQPRESALQTDVWQPREG